MAALGSNSSKTAPAAAQAKPAPRQAAAEKAVASAPSRPSPQIRAPRPPAAHNVEKGPERVEPGVTGKEKRWQQNRQFGPGAFKPYKGYGSASPAVETDLGHNPETRSRNRKGEVENPDARMHAPLNTPGKPGAKPIPGSRGGGTFEKGQRTV